MGAGLPDFPAMDALEREVCAAQERNYDLDVLRHSLTVAWLRHAMPERLTGASTACVIGDGFGTMTAVLAGSRSAGRILLVNLTRTLLVDLWYLRLWLGAEAFDRRVVLVTDADGLREALSRRPGDREAVIIALQAQHHELLRECPVDLAFNMASMGEMDPPVTAAYFADLRTVAAHRPNGLAFYCCNREEKTLPDGTVTRFSNYPWHPEDRVLVDELCPWHQHFYTRMPPFYRQYDGPVRHRLAILSAESRPDRS